MDLQQRLNQVNESRKQAITSKAFQDQAAEHQAALEICDSERCSKSKPKPKRKPARSMSLSQCLHGVERDFY